MWTFHHHVFISGTIWYTDDNRVWTFFTRVFVCGPAWLIDAWHHNMDVLLIVVFVSNTIWHIDDIRIWTFYSSWYLSAVLSDTDDIKIQTFYACIHQWYCLTRLWHHNMNVSVMYLSVVPPETSMTSEYNRFTKAFISSATRLTASTSSSSAWYQILSVYWCRRIILRGVLCCPPVLLATLVSTQADSWCCQAKQPFVSGWTSDFSN